MLAAFVVIDCGAPRARSGSQPAEPCVGLPRPAGGALRADAARPGAGGAACIVTGAGRGSCRSRWLGQFAYLLRVVFPKPAEAVDPPRSSSSSPTAATRSSRRARRRTPPRSSRGDLSDATRGFLTASSRPAPLRFTLTEQLEADTRSWICRARVRGCTKEAEVSEPVQLLAVIAFIGVAGAWVSFRRHNAHVRNRQRSPRD